MTSAASGGPAGRRPTVIAHLSDLEFGAENPAVVAGLAQDLSSASPDLVVVSGDITHRSKRHQFQAASRFLESLPSPVLAVAGNHDVPLLNVGRRALRPLERFRRHVERELDPFALVGCAAVLGLTTARPHAVKGGRLSREQTEAIRHRFGAHDDRIKVLVIHHPLVLPPGRPRADAARRSARAMRAVEEAGVDIVLSGHLHQRWISGAFPEGEVMSGSPLIVEAGTSCSMRTRDEPNSYALLSVVPEPASVEIETRTWNGREFRTHGRRRFMRSSCGWEE